MLDQFCQPTCLKMAIIHDLVTELISFIFLYGFDLGMDISVLLEAQHSYNAYRILDNSNGDTSVSNNESKHITFCSSGPWNKDDYQREIKSFGKALLAMIIFTALACFLTLSFLVGNILIIYRTATSSRSDENQSEKYVTVKFVFGFVCSVLQDIPLTCLAVDLYIRRSGPQGLTCWACYHDETCADKHVLRERFDHTRTLLAVSLTAAAVVSLYKGLTTFYRWSRVDNCRCYEIRACVSIFVGVCFAIVILTPCLGLLKFSLFTLPSESGSVFSGITDKLFMIGVMIWGVFIVVVVCCPLLRCIQHVES